MPFYFVSRWGRKEGESRGLGEEEEVAGKKDGSKGEG